MTKNIVLSHVFWHVSDLNGRFCEHPAVQKIMLVTKNVKMRKILSYSVWFCTPLCTSVHLSLIWQMCQCSWHFWNSYNSYNMLECRLKHVYFITVTKPFLTIQTDSTLFKHIQTALKPFKTSQNRSQPSWSCPVDSSRLHNMFLQIKFHKTVTSLPLISWEFLSGPIPGLLK